MKNFRFIIAISFSTLIMGCSHTVEHHDSTIASPLFVLDRQPSSTHNSTSNDTVLIYRIEIGYKSSATPVDTLPMPKPEFDSFLTNLRFRTAEYRRKTFFNGCYLFYFRDNAEARSPAASHVTSTKNIFCYESRDDRFFPISDVQP